MHRFTPSTIGLVAIALVVTASRAADLGPGGQAGTLTPFLARYCVGCHSGDKAEGDETRLAEIDRTQGHQTGTRASARPEQLPPF